MTASSSIPYVGLVPYSEDQEPYFFGRTRERRTVASNLRASRLTLLYGPAGVGKSSVLSAGVSHDLNKLSLENLENFDRPEIVVVVFKSWRDNPIQGLIQSVGAAAAAILPDNTAPHTEPTLVKTIDTWSKELDTDFLIILDQFEDYFLRDKQDSFGHEFTSAVNNSSLRANFLVSIREDALSKLDIFKPRIPRLFENYLRLEHLRTAAAHDSITRPIACYNATFKPTRPFEVEPELVKEVSKQIVVGRVTLAGAMGRQAIEMGVGWLSHDPPIEAPLLQLVMKRLWEEERSRQSPVLRLQTLRDLGDTETIVKSHLDAEMEKLSQADRKVADAIFYHLVTPSGWKVAHTVEDLVSYTKQQDEVLEPVLERLTEARVLRRVPPTRANQTGRYEIFHEVLAPAVSNWFSRYRLERETEAERLRLGKKSRRALLFSLVTMVIALVCLLVFGYVAQQKRSAEQARQVAQLVREDREAQRIILNRIEGEIPYLHAVMRGHTGVVTKAVFSPRDNVVATISEDGSARLWNADTGIQQREIKLAGPLMDMAFNSKGTRLAIASGHEITLWDPSNGNSEILGSHDANVTRVAFSKNDRLLASGDEEGVSIVWDVNEKREMQRPSSHEGRINDLEWSSQGPQLVMADSESTAQVWDVDTRTGVVISNNRGQLPSPDPSSNQPRDVKSVNTAVFSPDGREILTAGADWTAKVWNAKTGDFIRLLPHDGAVHSAVFGRTGLTILTASGDGTARLWDVTKKVKYPVMSHSDEVLGARFSPDFTRVITWSKDRTARLWDASNGKIIGELRGHIRPITSAEFAQSGSLVLTASADYTARVWAPGEARTLKVSENVVSVDPSSYTGPCTAYVRVYGRISVQGTGGAIRYRFVLNGNRGPERPLDFDEPGTKEVGGVYKFDGDMRGSVYLEITAPKNLSSENLNSETRRFRVRCEPKSFGEVVIPPSPSPTP